MTGTPTIAQAGLYSNIVISVSDGVSSAALPMFGLVISPITVSSGPPVKNTNSTAKLTWIAPAQNTDGTPITNLAGYRIYYGTSATAMTQTVQISDPSALSFEFTNLAGASIPDISSE